MDDLIRRQDAVDELKKYIAVNRNSNHDARIWEEGMNCAVTVIGALPSAQPEIIRCEDCKYSDTFPENADYDMPLKCLGIRYGGVFPDWYCEHAERQQRL